MKGGHRQLGRLDLRHAGLAMLLGALRLLDIGRPISILQLGTHGMCAHLSIGMAQAHHPHMVSHVPAKDLHGAAMPGMGPHHD